MAKRDVTERFSGRAEVYDRFRPGSPASAVEVLIAVCGTIHAVEPNADMRTDLYYGKI